MTAKDDAVAALESDAGCDSARAKALLDALAAAAQQEAIELAAGRAPVFGSALDSRVARLRTIVEKLPGSESLPNQYEIGVIFRVTPAQGRTVLRTYQARHSEEFRGRMDKVLSKVKPMSEDVDRKGKVYVWRFDDRSLLDYAIEKLRRHGITRRVWREVDEGTLIVDRDIKSPAGDDARQILGQ